MLHTPLWGIQHTSFDALQVRLYNRLGEQKHHHTTPVWSWLGWGKPISASFTTLELFGRDFSNSKTTLLTPVFIGFSAF